MGIKITFLRSMKYSHIPWDPGGFDMRHRIIKCKAEFFLAIGSFTRISLRGKAKRVAGTQIQRKHARNPQNTYKTARKTARKREGEGWNPPPHYTNKQEVAQADTIALTTLPCIKSYTKVAH